MKLFRFRDERKHLLCKGVFGVTHLCTESFDSVVLVYQDGPANIPPKLFLQISSLVTDQWKRKPIHIRPCFVVFWWIRRSTNDLCVFCQKALIQVSEAEPLRGSGMSVGFGYLQNHKFFPGNYSQDSLRPFSSGKLKSCAFSPGMARRRTEARCSNPPTMLARPSPTGSKLQPKPPLDALGECIPCAGRCCKVTFPREGVVTKHVLHAAVAMHRPPPRILRPRCWGISGSDAYNRVVWHRA